MKIGFDNNKYLEMQSQHIRERISKFGDKLYLEFGGKLFDDYHASRVLPGFQPDSKLKMLLNLKDQAEIVIAISAEAIEKNKELYPKIERCEKEIEIQKKIFEENCNKTFGEGGKLKRSSRKQLKLLRIRLESLNNQLR